MTAKHVIFVDAPDGTRFSCTLVDSEEQIMAMVKAGVDVFELCETDIPDDMVVASIVEALSADRVLH